MSEISKLRNLGKMSAQWLGAIGVHTEEELRALGSVNAYRLLMLRGYRPSLNLVWGIEAALRDVHWLELPDEVKAQVRRELESPWDARELLADE
jgi:DNA transformation protein and related proteins